MKKQRIVLIWSLLVCISSAQTNGIASDVSGGAHSGLHLTNAALDQVLTIYEQVKARSLLQHPRLKVERFSIETSSPATADTINAIETSLRDHGIAVLPDGDKFIQIVPVSLTNSVSAAAPVHVSSNANNSPRGAVNFLNAPIAQVLMVYGSLVGKEVENVSRVPYLQITFHNVTPLEKSEVIYALDTLFAWNGIKIVPVDEKTCKAVPFRQ